MALEMFNTMQYGRANGIAGVLVSSVFMGVTWICIVYTEQYSVNLLYISTIIGFGSIGLLVFPGGKFTKLDIPAGENELKYFWDCAPVIHKTVWVISLIGGLIAGLYLDKMIGGPLFNL